MDTADMSSWMPITGATDADRKATQLLRVMATYTDAAGTDMAMQYSMPTMTTAPEFADSRRRTWQRGRAWK